MVWLIAGLPAIAVVASFTTYFIAADNPDTLVNGGYNKEGLAPLKDTAKEERAVFLGIKAELALGNGHADVNLSGNYEKQPANLVLLLMHPTDAAQDRRIVLKSVAQGRYSGPMPEQDHIGKRQWILESDQDWRMSGELVLPLNGTLKIGKDSLLNPP